MTAITFVFITTWAYRDQVKALAQGWRVGRNAATGQLAILREDTAGVFPDDDAAVAYVRDRAKHGDMLAHTALEITGTQIA